MSIRVRCKGCGTEYKVPDEQAGRTVKCRNSDCSTGTIEVPGTRAPAAPTKELPTTKAPPRAGSKPKGPTPEALERPRPKDPAGLKTGRGAARKLFSGDLIHSANLLLDDQAPHAKKLLAAIAQRMQQREWPALSAQLLEVRQAVAGADRTYLRFRTGSISGYLLVHPCGKDLHVAYYLYYRVGFPRRLLRLLMTILFFMKPLLDPLVTRRPNEFEDDDMEMLSRAIHASVTEKVDELLRSRGHREDIIQKCLESWTIKSRTTR